jgi:hypothetical protein
MFSGSDAGRKNPMLTRPDSRKLGSAKPSIGGDHRRLDRGRSSLRTARLAESVKVQAAICER